MMITISMLILTLHRHILQKVTMATSYVSLMVGDISFNMLSIYSNKLMTSIDSLSYCMVILSLFIIPPMLVSNVQLLTNKLLVSSLMFLCLILILCFSLYNMIMFYVLFEATILPIMMIIMTFGYQPERVTASMYIMLYTMVASLPLLISLLLNPESLDFFLILYSPSYETTLISWSMILAFLVKTPIYTSHSWLPKAHVEAPVAGSIMLAGVLLKLGIYAIMRLMSMKFLFTNIMNVISSVALWGSCLASMTCFRQTDMKCLIANSSVAHMGLGLLNTLANSSRGWVGATLLLVSHGVVSSMLFYLGGAYYLTSKTRNLPLMYGIHLSTTLSVWWCIAMASNSAIPPSINVMAELSLIMAAYSYSHSMMTPIAFLNITSLLYSTMLYITLHHGEKTSNKFNSSNKLQMSVAAMFSSPIIILSPYHTHLLPFLS